MSANKEQPKKNELQPRPPIVVVMGHIDHGKTTLLDYIRNTKIVESETGKITQHISAYEIEIPATGSADSLQADSGQVKKITFLDTPGHEAFSKMRSCGAKIADIAILVVAADDGVKAQTKEAIAAIKESNIPFIVAINKVDKENAAPDKVKKELSETGIQVEEWGGKIPSVNISAKTGQGIDELLEMLVLVAEMEELKTDSNTNATGYVLESNLDKKRGIAATLIIQNGILKQGMWVAAKDSIGGEAKAVAPVRIFENFLAHPIKEAAASSPVKVIGFNKMPESGCQFQSYWSKKETEAALVCQSQKETKKEPESEPESNQPDLDSEKTVIPVVIKADTRGSAEAICYQLEKLQKEIAEETSLDLNILRAEAGDINEDDVKLAGAGKNAIIIGFNTAAPFNAKILAERFGVQIKIFNIIYEAEDWLKKEIEKRTKKEAKEKLIGKATVLKIFKEEKSKKIIGGEVKTGKITSEAKVKIYRRDYLLGEGKILELQHNKNKAEEVSEKEQFGLLLETKVSIAPKDILEIYNSE